MPLQDYEASNSVTPKMVVLDAGRYQVRKRLLLAESWVYITSLRENVILFFFFFLFLVSKHSFSVGILK